MPTPDHEPPRPCRFPRRRRAVISPRATRWSAIGLCTLLLLAFEGRSIRHSGEEMTPGWERSLVLAVGRPAGAVSDALGLARTSRTRLVGWAHPDDGLSGPGGFDQATAGAALRGVPPVTPDAFDPRALGAGRPRAAGAAHGPRHRGLAVPAARRQGRARVLAGRRPA